MFQYTLSDHQKFKL